MSELTLVTYLARSGVGSRRRCDELVRDGAVAVNGAVVTLPRQRIEENDVVTVAGEAVEPQELRYILVNKPRGAASTRKDPHAEQVVVDLVPNGRMLFPVGRLDVETTGLIVLTNDGPLANRLMHPRYGVPKTYVSRVRGKVGKRSLAALRGGIELEDGPTAPAEVRLVKQSAKTAVVEIVLHEGRKRQVRRMFAALGLPVEELHRRRYGPLTDKNLKLGGWRELQAEEVDALRRASERVEECVHGEPEEVAVGLAAQTGPDTPAAPPDATAGGAHPHSGEQSGEAGPT